MIDCVSNRHINNPRVSKLLMSLYHFSSLKTETSMPISNLCDIDIKRHQKSKHQIHQNIYLGSPLRFSIYRYPRITRLTFLFNKYHFVARRFRWKMIECSNSDIPPRTLVMLCIFLTKPIFIGFILSCLNMIFTFSSHTLLVE